MIRQVQLIKIHFQVLKIKIYLVISVEEVLVEEVRVNQTCKIFNQFLRICLEWEVEVVVEEVLNNLQLTN